MQPEPAPHEFIDGNEFGAYDPEEKGLLPPCHCLNRWKKCERDPYLYHNGCPHAPMGHQYQLKEKNSKRALTRKGYRPTKRNDNLVEVNYKPCYVCETCTCKSEEPADCLGQCTRQKSDPHDCICLTKSPAVCRTSYPHHDCTCHINLQSCRAAIHKCTCSRNTKSCRCEIPENHTCIHGKPKDESCTDVECRRLYCRPCTCDKDVLACTSPYHHPCTCPFEPLTCKARKSQHYHVCEIFNDSCRQCGTYVVPWREDNKESARKKATKRQQQFIAFCTNYTECKVSCPCSGNVRKETLTPDTYYTCRECTVHFASSKGKGLCQCCNVTYRKGQGLPTFDPVKFFLQVKALQTAKDVERARKPYKTGSKLELGEEVVVVAPSTLSPANTYRPEPTRG